MKRKSHALPAALGLGAALLAGLVLLMQWSFAPGNVYPPYSTLRTDPLGASALLESLQAMPGQAVSRNYQPLPRLAQLHAGATIVELGGDFEEGVMQPLRDYALLEELLAAGSRLVILPAPVVDNLPTEHKKEGENSKDQAGEKTEKKAEEDRKEASAEKEKEKGKDTAKHLRNQYVSLCEKWGFALDFLPLPEKPASNSKDKPDPQEAMPVPGSGFEKSLHWSSHLAFRNLAPEWKVLYEKKGRPVLIERTFGKGSIVLGSDAYFASNEALRSDRRTDLILHVLGPGKNIIFSETQHGLYESTGLAGLLRKYHLHGALACLFLLAALFVWRSVFSLIPPLDKENESVPVSAGPTARDGLTHLLQRNLTPLQALQEGMDRWIKSCGKGAPEEVRLKAHDYLFDLRSDKKFSARNIPGVYKTLQTMMTERK